MSGKSKEHDSSSYSELILQAAAAYGIAEEYIFSASERGGVVTIVTAGGMRVRYADGDKVKKLPSVKVSGLRK